MKISDQERDAFLSGFEEVDISDKPEESFRRGVMFLLSLLVILAIISFVFVQLVRPQAVEHYQLIYDVSHAKADMMLRSKALIGMFSICTFTVVFVLGRGMTMFSIGLLVVLMNGLQADLGARLGTPGAITDMNMNIILLLRLAMIAIAGRISYLCLTRNRF